MKTVLLCGLICSLIAVSAAIDCYTCANCGDPFDPTASGVLNTCPDVLGVPNEYCLKAVVNGVVTRTCGGSTCMERCVGDSCTYCCGTNLCNGDGRSGSEDSHGNNENVLTCDIPALSPGLVVDYCTGGGTTYHNTMCQYSCMTGYTMNGMSSVTCGSDGMFSPSIPTCDSILDWSSGSEDSNRNNRFGILDWPSGSGSNRNNRIGILDWSSGSGSNRNNRFGILDWSSGSGSNRNNRFVSAAIDCYTCEGTDCGDPFNPDASGVLDTCPSVTGGPKKYCWKVVHSGNVSRGCGNFCSEGCVGSRCTSCCGTDRCNGGTAVKTSFDAMGVALFAVFIFSKQ